MKSKSKEAIVIIGGGPAAMMLACTLDPILFDVTIVEKGKAIGRKFLVAGKGGFNLTHSEDIDKMIEKYEGPKSLLDSLSSFTNNNLRHWLSLIGIETYVGSSKRVFPIKGIKPIAVLQAIKKEIERKDITLLKETLWSGSFIENSSIQLLQKEKNISLKADRVIFALGGGSWKITGSDGCWLPHFKKNNVATLPFRPSNCSMCINWPENMEVHFGKPIKNIALTYNDTYIKGEMMVTKHGIEGSPAYALSYYVGNELESKKSITVFVDLKPSLSLEKVNSILSKSDKKTSKLLRDELSLSSTAVALIKSATTREEFNDVKLLTHCIKKLPLSIIGLEEIDNAISTVGGIKSTAMDKHFELINFPNHYAIGEMINWNAPTGGYLLQGCFSMGYALGKYLNKEHQI